MTREEYQALPITKSPVGDNQVDQEAVLHQKGNPHIHAYEWVQGRAVMCRYCWHGFTVPEGFTLDKQGTVVPETPQPKPEY